MSTATTAYDTEQAEALLENLGLDLEMGMGMDAPAARGPMAPSPRPKFSTTAAAMQQPAHEVPPAPRSRVLPRLLAMADTYLRAGSIRQALDMYFDLARNHPEAPEAAMAEDRILEVARIHEENGELHLARAIYEQMI